MSKSLEGHARRNRPAGRAFVERGTSPASGRFIHQRRAPCAGKASGETLAQKRECLVGGRGRVKGGNRRGLIQPWQIGAIISA